MLELLWPWALWVLPLPWLVRWLLPAVRDSGDMALRIPFFDDLSPLSGRTGTMPVRLLLPVLAWLLLCLAATRPVWIGEALAQPASGRDLLLAVDVSGSMAKEDMDIAQRRVSRLAAVKVVIGDFLTRRIGDRIGLLLFGQRPYLITPLTFDRDAVGAQLLESQVGIAGRETAIGDAIGLAVKRLRERPQGRAVIVLLTDGVNTAGELDPLKASDIAAAEGVRVYTIGVGSEDSSPRLFGLAVQAGGAEIDETTLKAVADRTGGRYFRAHDTAELAGIYAELDRLEPVESEGEPLRPQRELFVWPLATALVLVLAGLALHGVVAERWT